ncbi:hypothetical protein Tco_1275846 [Tanacetum coccineum]
MKSLSSSSGTRSKRSKIYNLMNSFWPTRSALSMLKSLERFWISVQELKVKNSLRYKMMMLPSPSSLTLATKVTSTVLPNNVCGSHASFMENSDSNYQQVSLWEDYFVFQIDHRKERNLRRKYMPFHRFTKYCSRLSLLEMEKTIRGIMDTYSDMMLKSRGKGSQGKKTADTPVVDVDVSEESDSEPARKRTASRRVVNKKVIISAADNIIPDLNATLELGKSISLTEASKEEAARQVHAIHARIVSKKVSSDPFQKLKGVQSITLEEQEATDTMQALKESKKTSKRQPCTGGTSEGNGRILGVPDESTIVFATSVKELIDSDKDKENKDDTNDDKSINLELTDDEETDDEFVHGVEQVNDDEDEEMTNVEVEEFRNTDEENTDAAKTDAGKTEEVKDDAKKAELPPTSSGLSVSSFGDQFLKVSSDTSLVSTVKDTTDAEINSLLDIKIQYEPSVLTQVQETPLVSPIITLPPPSVSTIPSGPYQTTAPIPTPPITTDAPTIAIVVLESDALSAVQLRVAKLEKDVFELKKIDYSAKGLVALKSQVPMVVEQYLGSKIGDDLQTVLQKHCRPYSEILCEASSRV